jgi:hypothetical protein
MTYIGGIEVLNKQMREQILKHLASDEKILYCIQSDIYNQALVALEHRLIVCRLYGVLERLVGASRPFDLDSVEYIDVKSIVVTSNPLQLSINNGTYFCIGKAAEVELTRFSEWLRTKVRQERTTLQNVGQPAPSMISELERLASLHQSGLLSSQEFEAAKRKLLGL